MLTGTTWQLQNGGSFDFGLDGDIPVIGDFSNSGVRTVGMVRGARHGVAGKHNRLTWYLRQVEGPGDPDLIVEFGRAGDVPIVGDWNGNGVHTIGVVRGNRWLLRNSNSPGPPDIDFTFGQPGDTPVVGDWNGNGRSGIGVVRGNRWLLSNSASPGVDHDFVFDGNGIPVTGDWNGGGRTGVGWFNDGNWRVRNSPTPGQPSNTFSFGNPSGIPLSWGRVNP